ncbi:MAG: hypothetical protein Q9164_000190 [Protoblastenia rupestris]
MPSKQKAPKSQAAGETFETMGVSIPIYDSDDETPLSRTQQTTLPQENEDSASSSDVPIPINPCLSHSKLSRKKSLNTALPPSTQSSNPPLRPAKDILSRIRYDPTLKTSDYIIGYQDRHVSSPMEMNVSAWKGGGDVTDEEWIPQHRILYFRREGDGDEGRHVWSRAERLDRIFGSGIPEAGVGGHGVEVDEVEHDVGAGAEGVPVRSDRDLERSHVER